MRKTTSLLVLAILILAPFSDCLAQKKTALVIGNAAYTDGKLSNPINDANDMSRALQDLGFEVIARTNADLRVMLKSIDEFRDKVRNSEVALFYYAGHGMQVNGENYLIPVGARISSESDIEYETIALGRIMGRMREAKVPVNIVILDACRDNPIARSFRSAHRGLAIVQSVQGSFIGFATAPGDTAADGTGRNGLYTKYILSNIRIPGLKIEEVFKKVRLDVSKESISMGKEQIPWDSSSLMGDFYFKPTPAPMPAATDKPPSPQPAPAASVPFVPATPPVSSKPAPAAPPPAVIDEESAYWQTASREDKLPLYEEYMKRYPQGKHASAAKEKIALHGKPLSAKAITAPDMEKDEWIEPFTGMEFIRVPGGCFKMGCAFSSSDCRKDEKPLHDVCLDEFLIGKYEATQGQWAKIMGANPSAGKKGDDYPVENISIGEVQSFIRKLEEKGAGGFRLPTEAEWEYACRSGGRDERYCGLAAVESAFDFSSSGAGGKSGGMPTGYDPGAVSWFESNSGGGTQKVGGKSANKLKIHDMSGNVWEFVQDEYLENAYAKHAGNNPVTSGVNAGVHVVRGGSWKSGMMNVRSASRSWLRSAARADDVGFRLVIIRR